MAAAQEELGHTGKMCMAFFGNFLYFSCSNEFKLVSPEGLFFGLGPQTYVGYRQ